MGQSACLIRFFLSYYFHQFTSSHSILSHFPFRMYGHKNQTSLTGQCVIILTTN